MNKILTLTVALSVVFVAGCNSADTSTSSKQAMETALPEGLFLDAAPSEAASLSEARANAEVGETVTFHGYIGGRGEPIVEDRALFLVADAENAPACTDSCKSPWDACCTSSEIIAANSATVQLVDESGQLLAANLLGKGGIKPGAGVTVVGKVRQADDSVFVIDATGLAITADGE